jgi:hypothetical protein
VSGPRLLALLLPPEQALDQISTPGGVPASANAGTKPIAPAKMSWVGLQGQPAGVELFRLPRRRLEGFANDGICPNARKTRRRARERCALHEDGELASARLGVASI